MSNFQKKFVSSISNLCPNKKSFGSNLKKWHHFSSFAFCIGFLIHSPPSSDKTATATSLSMEMVQNFQETRKTKLYASRNQRGPSARANFPFFRYLCQGGNFTPPQQEQGKVWYGVETEKEKELAIKQKLSKILKIRENLLLKIVQAFKLIPAFHQENLPDGRSKTCKL